MEAVTHSTPTIIRVRIILRNNQANKGHYLHDIRHDYDTGNFRSAGSQSKEKTAAQRRLADLRDNPTSPWISLSPNHFTCTDASKTASSFDSPLCLSITPSLYHSGFKTYLFHKSYPAPVVSLLNPPEGLPSPVDYCPDR